MITPGLSQRMVGRTVEVESTHGSAHHGVIISANYNPLGETVLVLHLEDSIGGFHNEVLVGRAADTIVDLLEQSQAA